VNIFIQIAKSVGRILGIRKSSKSRVSVEKEYEFPSHICASKIIITGPSYGDKTYFASFIVDADKLISWAFDHSKGVWSSSKNEQKAREILPVWMAIKSEDKESYISILDGPMRQVLAPYIYDFYLKGWVSYYCHLCHSQHQKLTENDHDHQSQGAHSSWIVEWICPNGHIIHRKQHDLMWIKKRVRSTG